MKNSTIIALALIASLGLGACGVDNTSVPPILDQVPATIPAEEEETNVPEETVIEEEIIPEETIEEPIEEEEPGLDTWNLDYDNAFSDQWGGVAWVDAIPLVEDPDLARYIVYFVISDGAVINITWVGPDGLGRSGALSKDKGTFVFTSEDFKYRFEAWGGKLAKGDYFLKDIGKEAILEEWDAVADTFTVVEDSETTYIVSFEVTYKGNGINYRGYVYFIDNLEKMEYYQFAYVVEESLFNEEDMQAVVCSIEYYEEE